MNQQLPIFSDVARWFSYPVLTQGANGTVKIPTAGGTGMGYVTLQPQSYFVFTNFRASTNYDNAVFDADVFGGGAAAPAGLIPPFPNNFTVSIFRGQNNTYSNLPMTQAEIASSGYAAGKQLPIPVVYGPRFNFSFTFTDSTGLFLSTGDGATVLPLAIDMFMEGYSVPLTQWKKFLSYFPSFAAIMDAPGSS